MRYAQSILIIAIGGLFGCSSNVEVKEKKVEAVVENPVAIEEVEVSNEIPVIDHPRCVPRNDVAKDDELYDLMIKLKTAIVKKDTALLFKVMDTGVIISHGGGIFGYDGLAESWEHDWDGMWRQLDRITSMGGAYENDIFYSYPFYNAIQNDIEATTREVLMMDPYTTYFALTDSVLMYASPSTSSKVIARLDRAFVNWMYDFQPEDGFIKLQSLDEEYQGFVQLQDVYRIGASSITIKKQKDGTWRITSFAPFD